MLAWMCYCSGPLPTLTRLIYTLIASFVQACSNTSRSRKKYYSRQLSERDGEPLAIAAKLRIQHGALAALLVPSPTRAIGAVLRAILKDHNPLEEGSGGVYEICERLAGSAAATMLAKLQSYAEIKLAPHNDGPLVMESTRRALARAGYNLEGYI
ncbi:MAG TPA: hypothetical protein VFP18_08150 [Candidatus Binatia bacterium]|nr:hypothetical protein [Candidatus Binatia bacterium]